MSGGENQGGYNSDIKELNLLMKKYAEDNNIRFIDLNKILSPNGFLDEKYTTDGIHLNGSAYILWAKEIKDYFEN